MSLRIKAVVDRFVQELKEALDADIQDRIMKEREMQSYIQEREREVAEREAAWKAELSRREVILSFSHSFKSRYGLISFPIVLGRDSYSYWVWTFSTSLRSIFGRIDNGFFAKIIVSLN
jgi:hypothetical protein